MLNVYKKRKQANTTFLRITFDLYLNNIHSVSVLYGDYNLSFIFNDSRAGILILVFNAEIFSNTLHIGHKIKVAQKNTTIFCSSCKIVCSHIFSMCYSLLLFINYLTKTEENNHYIY